MSTSLRFEVDGETFEVRPSEHLQGFDVDWVTGPNAGYGFSCSISTSFTRRSGPGRGRADGRRGYISD